MPLSTGTLKLKGFPASGNTSIAGEVLGTDFSGTTTLLALRNAADGTPTIGAVPVGMTEFKGFEQSWGRMFYERTAGSADYEIWTVETDNYYKMTTTIETESFEFTRNELTVCFKNNSHDDFTSGDTAEAWFYRRDKQTSDSWVESQSWLSPGYYGSEIWGENADDKDQKWEINACLLEGTKLFISEDKKAIPVENLIIGMEIYTAHEETHEFGMYKVKSIIKTPVQQYMHVIFEDGSEIRCSHSHRFMIPKGAVGEGERDSDAKLGRILAGKVKEGTEIYQFDRDWNKSLIKVKSITMYDTTLPVYKLEIEEAHTMITDNGVFHHNVK